MCMFRDLLLCVVQKEEDAASDTSGEFVLEGDTDTEDNVDDSYILAAQTVPCDIETQVALVYICSK